jgi:ankyrin repeat protein
MRTLDLQQQDGVIHDIRKRAKKSQLAQATDGRNELHCLAYMVCLPPKDDELEGASCTPAAKKEAIGQCVGDGVDVNAFDENGATPLHSFVTEIRYGEESTDTAELIELLILIGADVNMRNRRDETALHTTVKLGWYRARSSSCGTDLTLTSMPGN